MHKYLIAYQIRNNTSELGLSRSFLDSDTSPQLITKNIILAWEYEITKEWEALNEEVIVRIVNFQEIT